MENLIIERENNTPYVNFNQFTGNLEINGTAIPEDTHKFFYPLTQWIDEFVKKTPPKVSIKLKFEYMNTSSSKWVLKLLQILAEYNQDHKCVSFDWYYDENDIYDTGHYYQSLLEVEFNFIEYR